MTWVNKNTYLCKGYNCNLRDNCYRYLTEPRYLQQYINPPPILNGKCDQFIDEKKAIYSDYDGSDNLFLRMGDFND